MMSFKTKNNKSLKTQSSALPAALYEGLSILVKLAPKELERKTSLCKTYLSIVEHLVQHHGPVTAAKQLKSYHNFIVRKSMELPVDNLEWVKSDKTGWPKKLKPFKYYCESSNPIHKHYVISLFRSFETFEGHVDTDISTITEPFSGNPKELHDFTAYCKEGGKKLESSLKIKGKFRNPKRSLSAKETSGPNGRTSTITLLHDALELSKDQSMKDSILMLAKHTCTPDTVKGMEYNLNFVPSQVSHESKPEGCIGRIAFIPDKGMKTRQVAIGDGFTAVALQPLQDYLQEILKGFKTSAVSKQHEVFDTISYRTSHGYFCGSSDATAFTDRFPIEPQQQLLEELTSAKTTEHWKSVIQRSFRVGDTGARYEVGQPMGLLSSGTLASLTHHALVEYCASQVLNPKQEEIFKRRGYYILGDDIVIFNKKVHSKYLQVCEGLGLQLNSNKSTVSRQSCEFAKQLYGQGHNISAITCRSLLGVSYDPTSVINLLQKLTDLGYCSIPAINLLDLFPKKYGKQLMPFLSNPDTFKFGENLIDWSEAPKGLSPSQYGWVWTEKQFNDALSYASLLMIQEEVDRMSNLGKDRRSRVSNKAWHFVENFYREHDVEPAYTKPFMDTLMGISTELSQLHFGETFSYEYRKFVKHSRSLDPNTHIYGKDKSGVNELNILIKTVNVLNGKQGNTLVVSSFDNYEEKILVKLQSVLLGSRLWA